MSSMDTRLLTGPGHKRNGFSSHIFDRGVPWNVTHVRQKSGLYNVKLPPPPPPAAPAEGCVHVARTTSNFP